MPAYRILVADLLSGTIREEMPFSTFSYSHVLNRPGAFAGAIGLRHPKATRINLDPGRTAIHVERDGAVVWSGILWSGRAAAGAGTLEVRAEGWWSYFRRRLIRVDKSYVATDQLAIVRDLVTYAQGITGGNIGVLVGAETSGVLRERNYGAHERKIIGQAIEQLSEVDNGFDFAIDVAWESGLVVKRLRLAYPRRGRDTQRVLELGTNLEELAQEIDATDTANLVDVSGAGEGPATLFGTAADATLLSSYPLLEDVVAYRDVALTATLTGYATAELRGKKRPRDLVPNLTVYQRHPDAQVAGLIVGDTVRVRGYAGWLAVDVQMRAMVIEVAVNENGSEDARLTLAREDATV